MNEPLPAVEMISLNILIILTVVIFFTWRDAATMFKRLIKKGLELWQKMQF